MTNEIDLLMDLDPLARTPRHVDQIIAYFRKVRGLAEQGVKPRKASSEMPKKSLDLAKLGLKKAPAEPQPTLRRKF